LRTYLQALTGQVVHIDAAPESMRRLPIFLGQMYEAYCGYLFGREFVLLMLRSEKHPPAGQVAKHAQIAIQELGSNVAFVFPTLPAYERKRLIQKHVPFVVPGSQTYLPMTLVDLREHGSTRHGHSINKGEKLTAPSQALLLYYLQKDVHQGMSLSQWAETLGYSPMTLTRVRRELEALELGFSQRQGRMMLLLLNEDRRALWNSALPHLSSPVNALSHARILRNDTSSLIESGATALARLTSMSAPRTPVYAMSSVGVKAAIEEGRFAHEPAEDDDTIIIEHWRYAPGILSHDGRTVDPLSLHLSLAEDPDERVQDALADLLGSMRW
jgi:hypothetical protein